MRASATKPAATSWALVLAGAACWAIAVPYLGRALGVRLDVPARVEIVDHVVPGVLVLAAAAVLAAGVRTGAAVAPGDARWALAAAVTFLAGFWIASTHATLVVEAAGGITPWDAALLHLSAGAPVLVAGTAMLARPFLAARTAR